MIGNRIYEIRTGKRLSNQGWQYRLAIHWCVRSVSVDGEIMKIVAYSRPTERQIGNLKEIHQILTFTISLCFKRFVEIYIL